MDHHILVLAMSTLNSAFITKYQFKGALDGAEHVFSCSGIGQLEVIPQFIEACKKTSITKMIILETQQVKENISDKALSQLKLMNAIPKDTETMTHIDFFKLRMETLLRNVPEYKWIDVDTIDPEPGFEKALNEIKADYKTCKAEKGDWKLWLDIHGGYREISMTMFTMMQALSISLPDELPGEDVEEMLRAVPIDGVYTTDFTPGGDATNIIDRTSFYRIYTEAPLMAYLNYGQHLLEALRPCDAPPFAFISYKRGVEDKKRFAFIGKLKNSGVKYWYDQGIDFGEEWAKELVRRNTQSCAFIALISKRYFSPVSYQCGKEIRIALDQGKPVLLVSVDGFMPKEQEYHWYDPEKKEPPITVTKEETLVFNSKNNIVLMESNGSIDENYTVQDEVMIKLKKWIAVNDLPC